MHRRMESERRTEPRFIQLLLPELPLLLTAIVRLEHGALHGPVFQNAPCTPRENGNEMSERARPDRLQQRDPFFPSLLLYMPAVQ